LVLPLLLLLLLDCSWPTLGAPLDASSSKRPELSREESMARLLREELRTLEASYPEFGSRKPQRADSVADVDLRVPEETPNNRVSDGGRALGGRASSTPGVASQRRPQPPFYSGSEHLAEKPALPPHVLKARSGDLARVRSRSRPVYKPLYSSSEHLAARPAIPLPQLEAYQNSKGAEGLAPYLEEEAKSGDPSAAPSPPRMTTSQPAGLSTRATAHPAFFPTRAKSPANEVAVEASTQEFQVKPVLFHAGPEELLGAVTTPEPSTRGTRTTVLSTPSTTSSSTPKVPTSAASPTPKPSLAPHSRTPVAADTPAPAVSPVVTQASAPASTATKTPDTVDTPTNLYLPDPLVLSNQHSRPQFSRFTPGTVPSSRTTHGAPNLERRTTKRFHTPTRSPPAFPPRRRMTFQPFKRTNRPALTPSGTTPTVWRQPSKPAFYAGADSALIKDIMPAVEPVPEETLVDSTPRSLLISTEPTVHLDDNFPEVPNENGEQNKEDQLGEHQSAAVKPDFTQAVQTAAPAPPPVATDEGVTVASLGSTKHGENSLPSV
ncbi:unnamed protein product, partial [Ixodes hexagonus]